MSTMVARDLAQDAWLKIWRSRDKGSMVEYPMAYLERTTRNTCLDYFKSKTRSEFNNGTFLLKPEIEESCSEWADDIDFRIDAKALIEEVGRGNLYKLRKKISKK